MGAAVAALSMMAGTSLAAPPISVWVVSSPRADMVSGGDALVEVRAPAGAYKAAVKLTLNGKDVSSTLTPGPGAGQFRALITGMKDGDNTLNAKLDMATAKGSATLKLRNHPLTGPIFSGPHLTPYECRTVESGMGEPLDANCSAATKIEYFYRAADNTFKPLADPIAARPADLTMTTTTAGKLVPYIVRVESGTINRTTRARTIIKARTKRLPRSIISISRAASPSSSRRNWSISCTQTSCCRAKRS
jgi:hypothetical protein